MALVFLALGCAALVAAVTVVFGTAHAAIVTGVATVFYFTLNVMLGAKHDDQAAAGLLSRLFRVSWVTYASNFIVWAAALAVFSWPIARQNLYDEVTITVVNELGAPVPDASVKFQLGWRDQAVTVGDDGSGQALYPLYWGPDEATIVVQQRGTSTEREVTRSGRVFADLTIGIQSSIPRFRVTHVTLRSAAIDTVLRGRTPPELASLFPNIAGVVRNSVWQQADEVLSFYNNMNDVPDDSETGYLGAVLSGTRQDGSNVSYDSSAGAQNIPSWLRDVRVADTRSVPAQFDLARGIWGCPFNTALGPDYRVEAHAPEVFFSGNHVRLDRTAEGSLRARGIAVAVDDSGVASVALRRLADYRFLQEVLQQVAPDPRSWSIDGSYRYLNYFVGLEAPAGIVDAHVMINEPVCGGSGGYSSSVRLTLPPPVLRVTVIENISSDVLSIGGIESVMNTRRGFSDAGVEETDTVPWPSGVLRPGEGIVVPRRVFFEGAFSPEEVRAWRSMDPGPTTFLSIERPRDAQRDLAFRQVGFTVGANQIVQRSSGVHQPGVGWRDRSDPPQYVLGPSVEHLTIRVNDVPIETREDSGLTLAVLAGSEVGSCPFVFVSAGPGASLINRGHVITDRIGAESEGTDRIYLGRRFDLIEVREIEHEVSQINRVRLIVRQSDGKERTYSPAQPVLHRQDTDYLTLSQGDILSLSFDYAPHAADESYYLEVTGYYTPLPTTFAERDSLRRQGFIQ